MAGLAGRLNDLAPNIPLLRAGVSSSSPDRGQPALPPGLLQDSLPCTPGSIAQAQLAAAVFLLGACLDGGRSDLEIRTHELLLLFGPSGSGKNTVLQLLGYLIKPTAGRVLVKSQDFSERSEEELARSRGTSIGFVFQQSSPSSQRSRPQRT